MKSACSWPLPTTSRLAEVRSRCYNSEVNRRLIYALATYAALAILATFTLEGVIRIATWVLLGGFALKTYLVVLKDRID